MKTFLPNPCKRNGVIFYLPKHTERVIFFTKQKMKVILSLDGIKDGKMTLLPGINFTCNCNFYNHKEQYYSSQFKTYANRTIKGTYLGPKLMKIITFEAYHNPKTSIVYLNEMENGIDLKTWSILSFLRTEEFNFTNKERKKYPLPIKNLLERVFCHQGNVLACSYVPFPTRLTFAPKRLYFGKYEYKQKPTCQQNCGTKGATLRTFQYGSTF